MLTISPRVLALLFLVVLASVFLTPITYLAYPVTSVEHHRMQTLLMRFGGGIVIPPVAIAVLWVLRVRFVHWFLNFGPCGQACWLPWPCSLRVESLAS